MSRALLREVIQDRYGNALAGATVRVYEPGTTTPISAQMHSALSGGTVLTNPLTTDANGGILVYLDAAQMLDLAIAATAHTQARTVPSAAISGDADVDHAAITLGTDAGAVLGLTGQQITLDSQDAKTFLAGPVSGQAADPSFRVIADADVPSTHAGSAHHAAVTLGGGSDAALSLSGQELTLADVLTPTEHTNIGTGSPHHAAVTAGSGIGLSGQQVSAMRTATLYVAASNATAAEKAGADYLGDGTADDVQINAAIGALA